MDIIPFFDEGKVEVFREPWQTVEKPQAGAAIEGGMVEETATAQAGKCDFLADLLLGIRRNNSSALLAILCQHRFVSGHCLIILIRYSKI